MSKITVELYDALRAAGIDEALAKRASEVVLSETDKDQIATKLDVEKIQGRINLVTWIAGASLAVSLFAIKLLIDVLQKLP